MSHAIFRFFLLALAFFVFSSTLAQAGSKEILTLAPAEEPFLGGDTLRIGVKANSSFWEGNLGYTYALIEAPEPNGHLVVLLDGKITYSDQDEFGATAGVIARRMWEDPMLSQIFSLGIPADDGFFVGANAYYDFVNTAAGSDFNQLGFGLEAGTRRLELRFNYYYPLDNAKTLSRNTSTETLTRGNQRITTRTTSEIFEEPLEGWNAEVALLVPYLDAFLDVQLLAGYYDFSGDRSSATVDGWRFGLETRPIPSLVAFVYYTPEKELYQDEWLAGARIEIPFGGSRSAGGLSPRPRSLRERLYDSPTRQNVAITTSGVLEEVIERISTTETIPTRQTITRVPSGNGKKGDDINGDDKNGDDKNGDDKNGDGPKTKNGDINGD
ncbi:MAG: inverse autotransporter beta domain-containing protein [Verrucomicrobiales bacterium]